MRVNETAKNLLADKNCQTCHWLSNDDGGCWHTGKISRRNTCAKWLSLRKYSDVWEEARVEYENY